MLTCTNCIETRNAGVIRLYSSDHLNDEVQQ